MLQDTTEFTYQRRDPHAVGFTKSVNSGRDKKGRLRHHAICGILMHSSLAVTVEGLPLGLAAVKFWNREKFKGTAQLKRKINPTRVPIEAKESIRWLDNMRQSLALLGQPERCIHIGDRESDIYARFQDLTPYRLPSLDLIRHCRPPTLVTVGCHFGKTGRAVWAALAAIPSMPKRPTNMPTAPTSYRGAVRMDLLFDASKLPLQQAVG
jgi:hypothetical protein